MSTRGTFFAHRVEFIWRKLLFAHKPTLTASGYRPHTCHADKAHLPLLVYLRAQGKVAA